MRIINMGQVGAIVADTELNPGAISENIDPILARKIVQESGGALAIAPEREHTPEELEHADEKPKPEPEPVIPPTVPPEGGEGTPITTRKGRSHDEDEKRRKSREEEEDEKKKASRRSTLIE